MIYDITDPANVRFADYINSRDFLTELGADDSPEGLKLVPAEKSPTNEALLLAACEVGGTVAVYELTSGSGLSEKMPIEIKGCQYNAESETLIPEFNVIAAENDEKTVIAAIYTADGALKEVIAVNKSFAANGTDTAEIDISSVPAGEYTYKIMAWNGL